MIAYKLVREDFGSLCEVYRVIYGEDWKTVGCNGAYCSATGEAIASGGVGPVLIRLEVEDEVRVYGRPRGITCWRRVRRVGIVEMPETWAEARRAYEEARRAYEEAERALEDAPVRAWAVARRALVDAYRACEKICIAVIKEDKK